MHVCLASGSGDRSYQDNVVLLTEIGFLCQSRPLESGLKAKLEGVQGADRSTASPCFRFASAWFVALVVSTFGWLDYETTDWPCLTYLRGGSPRQRVSCPPESSGLIQSWLTTDYKIRKCYTHPKTSVYFPQHSRG